MQYDKLTFDARFLGICRAANPPVLAGRLPFLRDISGLPVRSLKFPGFILGSVKVRFFVRISEFFLPDPKKSDFSEKNLYFNLPRSLNGNYTSDKDVTNQICHVVLR